MDSVDTIVIGSGQAGLATSHELTRMGTDHVILERDRVAQSWRDRWDSFHLVLPNWTIRLPGKSYDGDHPDGFMPRDEIVTLLEGYARMFDAPVQEGVSVTNLARTPTSWVVHTSQGDLEAATVVVATGSFRRPHRPPESDLSPPAMLVVDAADYRNPAQLPPGKVLIVGSGQSGCQIAEDLVLVGREVFLACGRSPWLPRRVADHDIFWWAEESGFMDVPLTALTDLDERLAANPQLSGRDGGHDLHFRVLNEMGVTLLGRFRGIDDGSAHFAPDLDECVAFGDTAYERFSGLIRDLAAERHIAIDDLSAPAPFRGEAPEMLDLAGFGAVVFATGFRPDYRSWIPFPDAFDSYGFPIQDAEGNGVLPGLHFVGVHFMRKRKSALLPGVGEDAAIIAARIGERLDV